MLFGKPPGVPCPPNNPHCQVDVPSVPIHSDIITFIIVAGILIYMLWIFKLIKIPSFKRKTKSINYEYKVIRVGNITVAQGLKCNKCGLIRPYEKTRCLCNC